MNALTPKQMIQRATIDIIRNHPFYARAILKQAIEPSDQVPTAATDGTKIIYNPEFVAGKSHDALVILLMHEADHILFGHHIRRDHRDPKGWNVAADLAINSAYVGEPGWKELDGLAPGIKPFDNLPSGKVSEWYYDQLPRQGGKSGGKKGDKDGGQDVGGFGEVLDSPLPAQEAEAERCKTIVECANADPGNIPAHLKSVVDSVRKPVKVPWPILLRRFCERACKSRLTFNKINRRMTDWPCRLPSRTGKTLGEICVVLDTSGSHWSDAPKILDHIEAIVKAYPKTTVRLIQFDAEASERVYQSSELPLDRNKWQMEGGGGTALMPAWRLAQRAKASCIVVYTDGYLHDWPTERSNAPVIWLMSTDHDVPCAGTVVRLNDE